MARLVGLHARAEPVARRGNGHVAAVESGRMDRPRR